MCDYKRYFYIAERRFIEKTETEKRFKERIKEIIEERDVLM